MEDIDDLTHDLVGRPCPSCGESLLTEDDFQAGLKVKGMIALMKALGLAKDADDITEGMALMLINPHAGGVTIKIGDK